MTSSQPENKCDFFHLLCYIKYILTKKIFGRDTLPYMKPHIQSFHFVNGEIISENGKNNDIYFFDDMVENLLAAERIGWKTVWISPDFMQKQRFIDYAFPNIYEALTFFKTNKKW